MNKEQTNQIEKRSYHIILLLLVGIIGCSILVGILVQKSPLIESIDGYFYQAIHKGFHHPFLDFLIKPFNYNFLPPELSPGRMPSYYYFMFLLPLIYLAIYKRALVGWYIFAFLFGTILAYAITALNWHFVFRERPFLSLPSNVDFIGQSAWKNLSSFPSGHARETAMYATLLASFFPKLKWPLIIFTIFIAYSRVYIGAHFPTDVIAGTIIGFLTAKTTILISRELKLLFQKRGADNHVEKAKKAKN